MNSKLVRQYVQQRIDATRKELASSANKQKAVSPVEPNELDQLADRIARRVFELMGNRPQQYEDRPEQYKAGFQGQYSDETLQRAGIFADEWKRLGVASADRLRRQFNSPPNQPVHDFLQRPDYGTEPVSGDGLDLRD
jgi:hypothetical protein